MHVDKDKILEVHFVPVFLFCFVNVSSQLDKAGKSILPETLWILECCGRISEGRGVYSLEFFHSHGCWIIRQFTLNWRLMDDPRLPLLLAVYLDGFGSHIAREWALIVQRQQGRREKKKINKNTFPNVPCISWLSE